MYQPATIIVSIKNSDGTYYSGNACVDIGAPYVRGAQEFCSTISGGIFTIASTSTIGGEQPVSGAKYTVGVRTQDNTKFDTTMISQTVPNAYPTDLTSTFNVTLSSSALTTKSCVITVKKGTTAVANARVDVSNPSGSPVQPYLTGTTNTSGQVTFTLPALGASYPYSVNSWSSSGTGGATLAVTTSSCPATTVTVT
jgi:hypothetical protein